MTMESPENLLCLRQEIASARSLLRTTCPVVREIQCAICHSNAKQNSFGRRKHICIQAVTASAAGSNEVTLGFTD